MQKMMQEMFSGIGGMGGGAFPGGPNGGGTSAANMQENPFMQACQQMFKDFENVSKESGGSAQGDPTSDPQMMSFLNNFAKEFMGGGGDGSGGADPAGMDKLLGEFSNFLKDSEGNEEMKSALDSVVNELLNRDTLYEPMKSLRDEYPPWLEANWDKIS
jgi:peroxin-19